jgi:hypothetical protein
VSGWEEAFVSTSVALGAPLGDVLAALGDGAEARVGPLVQGLRSADRAQRAYALATAIAGVARELDATGMT